MVPKVLKAGNEYNQKKDGEGTEALRHQHKWRREEKGNVKEKRGLR